MESHATTRDKTRAVPRQSNSLLSLSAILLIVGGAAHLVLGLTPLRVVFQLWVQDMPCFAFISAGVLILSSRTQPAHYVAALPVLLLGSLGLGGDGNVPVLLALALMLASAIGLRLNVTIGALPKPIRIPVLNLAAAALTLLGALQLFSAGNVKLRWAHWLSDLAEVGLSSVHLAILALATLLLFAGIFLLNLSVEPQTVEPSAAPRLRFQSVPRQGDGRFTAGAALLIAAGAWRVYLVLSHTLAGPTAPAVLQVLFLLAAGFLLLSKQWQKKSYLLAAVLLAVNLISNPYWQPFGALPVTLMLLSAIGAPWNAIPDALPNKLRVPALNLAAAALLAATGLHKILAALRSILGAALLGPTVKALIPVLLLTAGLILLNLCLDSQAVQKKAEMPDRAKYKKGLSGLVQRFYRDVGGNLQKLAKIQGIICLVIAGLSAVAAALGAIGLVLCLPLNLYEQDTFLILLLAGGGGLLTALIGAVMTLRLYAFGQITSDVRHLKDQGISVGGLAPVSPAAAYNPDELPEL